MLVETSRTSSPAQFSSANPNSYRYTVTGTAKLASFPSEIELLNLNEVIRFLYQQQRYQQC